MATFRRVVPRTLNAESPALLFRDLDRSNSVKFLWGHQEKLLDEYSSKHRQTRDLAIELPTGAGKTLVGLLIAEYCRRANGESVAYLCPTRQLASQVTQQALTYGIKATLLVGKQRHWNDSDFMRYQMADSIAVTTYSGIFNNNPRIDCPQLVICDDAHAAANYVSSMWTVRVSKEKNSDAFVALANVLRDSLRSPTAEAVENAVAGRDFPRAGFKTF